jgi:hypothetical protein
MDFWYCEKALRTQTDHAKAGDVVINLKDAGTTAQSRTSENGINVCGDQEYRNVRGRILAEY